MTDPTLPRTSSHINLLDNDEISLIDIFRLLKERKKIVFGFVLLGLIISMGRWFLIPSVYQSNAVIEIGKIANSPLVEVGALTGEIIHEYGLQNGNINQKSYIMSATLGTHPFFVTISSLGPSAIQAQTFLETVVSKIMLHQKKLYSQWLATRQAYLIALNNQIEIDKQVSSKFLLVPRRKGERIPGIVSSREEANVLAQIPNLLEKHTQLILEMSAFESWPSRLVQRPSLPSRPIKPNFFTYVSLGGGLGLIIGIFAVFVSNIFLSKAGH